MGQPPKFEKENEDLIDHVNCIGVVAMEPFICYSIFLKNKAYRKNPPNILNI